MRSASLDRRDEELFDQTMVHDTTREENYYEFLTQWDLLREAVSVLSRFGPISLLIIGYHPKKKNEKKTTTSDYQLLSTSYETL